MKFLCDDCKWNYPRACRNPNRPNLRWDDNCVDYTPRYEQPKVDNPFAPDRVGYYKGDKAKKQSVLKRIIKKIRVFNS